MIIRLFLALALALALAQGVAQAADDAAVSKAESGLRALVEKIQTKLRDQKNTEADLQAELKEFDALLAQHKDEKTDEVARILYMKAMLYLQVFDNTEKGLALVQDLKNQFPDTELGKNADQIIDGIKKQEEAKKIQRSLAEGSVFPDFQEKDLEGKALSLASYRGKIVLVDFWATWCGPCVAELPTVLKAYEKYHGKGFEIVGISLDKEEAKLRQFIKDKKMTWAQYFDGKGWQNKLSTKYGVNSIPATYLLDGEGKIVAKDLRGEALEEAIAKHLPKI
jgi:thiol-disulfide isomerase/thioredoxin